VRARTSRRGAGCRGAIGGWPSRGTEQASAGDFVVGREREPRGELSLAAPAADVDADLGHGLERDVRAHRCRRQRSGCVPAGRSNPQLSFAAARALGVVLHCHPSHSGMGGCRRRQGCKGNQYSVKTGHPQGVSPMPLSRHPWTTLTSGLAMGPTEDCSPHASAFTLTDQLCFWRAVAWPRVPADQGEEGTVRADSRAEILTPIHVTKY
jgi:hypothetical protein